MEEVSALRVSLGLNTAEFSAGMKDINARLRAIKSEFSAADNGTKSWRNSLEGLQSKAEMLNRQLEVQREKLSILRQEYNDVAAAQGEDSRAAQNLLTQYNNAVGVMRRMESSLENVSRRINEQTSDFGQLQQRVNTSVESMDRELRVLESSMNDVNTTMGHSHGSASQMGAGLEQLRTRHDQLNQSIEIQQRRLQELNTLLEATTREEGTNSRAAQEMQIRYNEAAQSLNRTQAEMHQVHSQIQSQSSVWGRLGQVLSGSMNQVGHIGMNLQMAGMNLAMSFAPAAAAVDGALKNIIETGAEFEAEMAKVAAKAGASADEMQRLSEASQQFAPLAGGATNAATAMDDLAAKGYSVNQIMEAMPGILNAANASGEDLALTSDTITSALESFHMQASQTSHVADVLAQTSNLTAAGMQDLQYTFKYAAPVASQLGISMEQLAAMTGIMANQGIRGEAAGTSLRQAMLRLADPPKEAAAELGKLGVKITDNQGNFRSFSDIIGDLNNSTSKMSNAQKAAAISQIFSTEATSGMLAVISAGKPKVDDFTTALKNSDGASQKAAEQMQNNFAGSLKKLSGALDAAKIGIEQSLAPALKKLADNIQKVIGAFNNLSPETKQFIAIGGIISGIVLTLASGLGILVMGIGGVVSAWGTITLATEAIGGTFAALAGPIGLSVAALGLLAAGIFALKKQEDESKKANLDHAQSLVEQQKSLKDLSDQYNVLHDKNKLSNDELLRYRDLQTELKTAKSDQEVKTLSGAMELLQQKSGLSNDELNQMLSLNDQIIQKTPDVKQAYSDRGNAIIQNKDALNEANAKLAENTRLELENQRIKAEANLTKNINDYVAALDALNAKEQERDQAIKERDTTEKQIAQLRIQAQQQLNSGKDQEAQKTIDEIAKNEILLSQQNGNVLSLANQVTEKQQNVNKTQEEIQKTQELYDKLINLQLAHVGINATGAEGIGQLDQAIQKTQSRIDELNAAKQSQGGLNAEQQTELTNLQNALGQYQAAKNEIGNIQGQQQGVNARIDEGTGKARNMNSELGKSTKKDVSIDDHGGADNLNEKVSEAKHKQVTIEAIWTGAKAALHAIGVPGFAVGTDFAPGGLALVGENGPELMYVPRGAQIKTASETRRLTSESSGTETVKTRGDINVQIYPQKAIIDQKDITRELQRMEALYG